MITYSICMHAVTQVDLCWGKFKGLDYSATIIITATSHNHCNHHNTTATMVITATTLLQLPIT